MNLYKATFKEKKDDNYWDMKPLLIIAKDYAEAEMLALAQDNTRQIASILLFGETSDNKLVFKLRER